MRRGQIWTATTLSSTRPVLVVQADEVTEQQPGVLVVPLTASGVRMSMVTVEIGSYTAHPVDVGRVMKQRLTEQVGEASVAEMDQMDMALRVVLGL